MNYELLLIYSEKSSHRYDRFSIQLQSLQIRIRSGFYLELRLASWAVTAIGLLTQVDIYNIITSP
jgi:hypothetical protein